MPKAQLQKSDNAPDASSTNDYTPKKCSARENAVMTLKILAGFGVFFGFLWIVTLLKAQ